MKFYGFVVMLGRLGQRLSLGAFKSLNCHYQTLTWAW